MVTANLTQAWASAPERRQLTWIDENQCTWNMGHEQNKQWGRTAGQNAILSCLWKEKIKAGRVREKEETGLKACQISALLRQFKSPKRHYPGWHIDDMNIFDYIKKHSGDHSELWSGAGIFLQAMREGKVQLVYFILVASGHGADVDRRDKSGESVRIPGCCTAFYSVVLKQTPVTMRGNVRSTMPLWNATL